MKINVNIKCGTFSKFVILHTYKLCYIIVTIITYIFEYVYNYITILNYWSYLV